MKLPSAECYMPQAGGMDPSGKDEAPSEPHQAFAGSDAHRPFVENVAFHAANSVPSWRDTHFFRFIRRKRASC